MPQSGASTKPCSLVAVFSAWLLCSLPVDNTYSHSAQSYVICSHTALVCSTDSYSDDPHTALTCSADSYSDAPRAALTCSADSYSDAPRAVHSLCTQIRGHAPPRQICWGILIPFKTTASLCSTNSQQSSRIHGMYFTLTGQDNTSPSSCCQCCSLRVLQWSPLHHTTP